MAQAQLLLHAAVAGWASLLFPLMTMLVPVLMMFVPVLTMPPPPTTTTTTTTTMMLMLMMHLPCPSRTAARCAGTRSHPWMVADDAACQQRHPCGIRAQEDALPHTRLWRKVTGRHFGIMEVGLRVVRLLVPGLRPVREDVGGGRDCLRGVWVGAFVCDCVRLCAFVCAQSANLCPFVRNPRLPLLPLPGLPRCSCATLPYLLFQHPNSTTNDDPVLPARQQARADKAVAVLRVHARRGAGDFRGRDHSAMPVPRGLTGKAQARPIWY